MWFLPGYKLQKDHPLWSKMLWVVFFPGLGGHIETPQSNTVKEVKFLMTRTLNDILDLMPKPCVKYILYTSAEC